MEMKTFTILIDDDYWRLKDAQHVLSEIVIYQSYGHGKSLSILATIVGQIILQMEEEFEIKNKT